MGLRDNWAGKLPGLAIVWVWRVRKGWPPRYLAKITFALGLLTIWEIRESGLADLVLLRLNLALRLEYSIKLKAIGRT